MRICLCQIVMLMLCACLCSAQGRRNYHIYHDSVRVIENDFFEKGVTTKKILVRYHNLFESYDFVYLQDCYTAMQLAIFLGDEKHFMKFMEKAMRNGLTKINLNSFEYILQSDIYKKNERAIGSLITENRPHYLSRLNKELLVQIVKIYAEDQAQKNCLAGESTADCMLRYHIAYQVELEQVMELIMKYGIPGDRLIGVDQKDILQELGIHNADLSHYYEKFKDFYNITPSQYELDSRAVASTLLIPLMWHGNCSFQKLKPLLEKELNKGNIHPRDIAIIKDEDYRSVNLCESRDSVYYNLGDEQLLQLSRQKINSNRANGLICSLESDSVKKVYQDRYNMVLRYGFIGKR